MLGRSSLLPEKFCYKSSSRILVFHHYTLSKPGCYTSTKNSSINIIPYIYCSLDNFIIILLIFLFLFLFLSLFFYIFLYFFIFFFGGGGGGGLGGGREGIFPQ